MHQVVTTPVDDWAHRVSVGGPSTKSKHRLALGHVKGRLASTLLYSEGSQCVDVMEQGQFRMVAKSSWSWTRCFAVALGTGGMAGGATGAGWSVQPAADVAALPLAFAFGLHFAGIAPGDGLAEAASRPKQPLGRSSLSSL